MSKPTGTTTAHAHYPNTDTGGWVVTICRGEQVGRGVSRDIGTAISAAAGDLIEREKAG